MTAMRAKARRYPIPAGYPVPAEHIPDMPIDCYHLHAFGYLSALVCRAMGVKEMSCGLCEAPCDLQLLRKPLGAEGVLGPGILGGLVWGDDVAVICPCCSHAGCEHRERSDPDAMAVGL
jgi:hypothetical protein